jgi:predicted ester cyclase
MMDVAARNRANYLDAKRAFNRRDIEGCLRFYAPGHQIMSRPSPQGRQEIQRFFESSIRSWPDLQIVVEQAVAEDDWVMGRSVTTATHTTKVFGLAPTQKRVETTFWDLHRFDDKGLIAETWNLMDSLTLMVQLGLMSAPK